MIKIDPETGEVVRNEQGLCVRCRPGDMGEMIGMIKLNDPMFRFEGYVNRDETKKKVIRDVTTKGYLKEKFKTKVLGDQVFTSGDILYWDEFGYLYFKVFYFLWLLKINFIGSSRRHISLAWRFFNKFLIKISF